MNKCCVVKDRNSHDTILGIVDLEKLDKQKLEEIAKDWFAVESAEITGEKLIEFENDIKKYQWANAVFTCDDNGEKRIYDLYFEQTVVL